MEQCSFCQGNVDPTTHLCSQCGRSQPVETTPLPPGAEALTDSATVRCQRCGAEVRATAHFCPNCRWPLMLAAPQSQSAREPASSGAPPDASSSSVDQTPAAPAGAPPSATPQTTSAPIAQSPATPASQQSAPVRVKSTPVAQRVQSTPVAQRVKSTPVAHLRGAPGVPRASLDTYLSSNSVAPRQRDRLSGKALRVVVVGVLLLTVVAIALVVLRGPLAARQQTPQGSSPGTVLLSFGDSSLVVDEAAWSPTGQKIALGESNAYGQQVAVQVIDATTGRVLLTHQGWSGGLAWMSDGKAIVSSKGDGTFIIWDASTGQSLLTFGNYPPGAPSSLALSHNGKLIAIAASPNAVDIWNAASGALITTYTSLSSTIHALAWSSADSRLAAAGENKNIVQIWNATTGATLLTYQGHATNGQIAAQGVRSLSWSPNGKEIASASQNGELRVWDASAGTTLWTYHGPLFQSDAYTASDPVAWSPDGARIAFANLFAGSQLFDASSGKALYSHQSNESGLGVVCLAWSPDNTKIIAGGTNKVGASVQVWLTK